MLDLLFFLWIFLWRNIWVGGVCVFDLAANSGEQVFLMVDNAMSGASKPDTSITTSALPPNSASQGEWVCLLLSAAYKASSLFLGFCRSSPLRLSIFLISCVFLMLLVYSPLPVTLFFFPPWPASLVTHFQVKHIIFSFTWGLLNKTIQDILVKRLGKAMSQFIYNRHMAAKPTRWDIWMGRWEEHLNLKEKAYMRDEVEMNESRTWKQMVLLIGCVMVCHCRHLHSLGMGAVSILLSCDR